VVPGLFQPHLNILVHRMAGASLLDKRQEGAGLLPLLKAIGQGLGHNQVGGCQLVTVREAFVEVLQQADSRFRVAPVIQGGGTGYCQFRVFELEAGLQRLQGFYQPVQPVTILSRGQSGHDSGVEPVQLPGIVPGGQQLV